MSETNKLFSMELCIEVLHLIMDNLILIRILSL